MASAPLRHHLDALGVSYEELSSGALRVEAGTAAVYLDVEEIDGHQIISLVSPLLVEVNATDDALRQLLELNAQLRFGKFSWHADSRTVSVDYELLGDVVDAEEIDVALTAVSQIADTCDERLLPLLGGRLAHGEPALADGEEPHAPTT